MQSTLEEKSLVHSVFATAIQKISFDQATIVDKARDYHKRLFLEAWHSQRDRNASDEHTVNFLVSDHPWGTTKWSLTGGGRLRERSTK